MSTYQQLLLTLKLVNQTKKQEVSPPPSDIFMPPTTCQWPDIVQHTAIQILKLLIFCTGQMLGISHLGKSTKKMLKQEQRSPRLLELLLNPRLSPVCAYRCAVGTVNAPVKDITDFHITLSISPWMTEKNATFLMFLGGRKNRYYNPGGERRPFNPWDQFGPGLIKPIRIN